MKNYYELLVRNYDEADIIYGALQLYNQDCDLGDIERLSDEKLQRLYEQMPNLKSATDNI
jgi:hypothetical protein